MLLRPFLNDAGSCGSYLFGCTSHSRLAVVDPHADLVDGCLEAAECAGSPIVADFEKHVQADHVSVADGDVLERGITLELPDHVVLLPSHYGGSVCGRGLSGNPFSSIGFERTHNPLLALADPDEFADALLVDAPPRPADQERIVAANRAGELGAPA